MGTRVPENGSFKDKILSEAESDKFRGQYLPWGSVHCWSMALGAMGGALVMYGIIASLMR